MSGPEMPIFTRTYDLLTWLVPVTNHFPRAHRHTVTRRLFDAAFDLRERLEEANMRHGNARMERLVLADEVWWCPPLPAANSALGLALHRAI